MEAIVRWYALVIQNKNIYLNIDKTPVDKIDVNVDVSRSRFSDFHYCNYSDSTRYVKAITNNYIVNML